jgi:hypothetical protein
MEPRVFVAEVSIARSYSEVSVYTQTVDSHTQSCRGRVALVLRTACP